MSKTGILILLIVTSTVAFEAWRLGSPAEVALKETWTFSTPTGEESGTRLVKLRQYGAVPYLPGGEVGRAETIGPDVAIILDGRRVSLVGEPRALIANAGRNGSAKPRIAMDDLRNEYTTGFIRRVARSKRIEIALDERPLWGVDLYDPPRRAPDGTMTGVSVRPDGSTITNFRKLARPIAIEKFEAAHPGIRLLRLTYTVLNPRIPAVEE